MEELKAGSKTAPGSLRPCAGDAYLLFQVSTKQVVNKNATVSYVHLTVVKLCFIVGPVSTS